MINISRETCTGCAACANICPINVIKMEFWKDGFQYPEIDSEKCIQCQKCMEVCPVMEHRGIADATDKYKNVYAMKSRDKELRIHSTSGGVFSELANIILDRGGCVAGAAYVRDWSVKEVLIEDPTDLETVRRSKYQQSQAGLIYQRIKKKLNEDRDVLFCGTPCQNAALKKYLRKDYSNLYLCDFICRGVPSPRLFHAYLADLEQIYHSSIEDIWMKNKRNGWHSLSTLITFENGEEYCRTGFEDVYVQLYLKYNWGIRSSCFACQFKGGHSAADLTIGDFWGLDGTEMDDNLGTSVVIAKTDNGIKLVNYLLQTMDACEKSIEQVKRANPCMRNSVEKMEGVPEDFMKQLLETGYKNVYEFIRGCDKK